MAYDAGPWRGIRRRTALAGQARTVLRKGALMTDQPYQPPPATPQTPPGWYPHPQQPGAQAYWDGYQWTGHVSGAGAALTSLPIADPGKRLLGYLIDVALLSVVGFLAFLPVAGTLAAAQEPGAGAGIAGLFAFLVFVAIFVYEPFCHGRWGQTVGKRVVGTKVVRAADGSPIGHGLAWGRYLILPVMGIVPLLPLIAVLWLLWDPLRQTLYDKVVGTVVINV